MDTTDVAEEKPFRRGRWKPGEIDYRTKVIIGVCLSVEAFLRGADYILVDPEYSVAGMLVDDSLVDDSLAITTWGGTVSFCWVRPRGGIHTQVGSPHHWGMSPGWSLVCIPCNRRLCDTRVVLAGNSFAGDVPYVCSVLVHYSMGYIREVEEVGCVGCHARRSQWWNPFRLSR